MAGCKVDEHDMLAIGDVRLSMVVCTAILGASVAESLQSETNRDFSCLTYAHCEVPLAAYGVHSHLEGPSSLVQSISCSSSRKQAHDIIMSMYSLY